MSESTAEGNQGEGSYDPLLDDFQLEYFGKVDELIPVYKYRSVHTGTRVVLAQVEGPLVNGYFCLGTVG